MKKQQNTQQPKAGAAVPFVRNQLTFVQPRGEINRLPSLTVPDQSLSVSDILRNHTRGIPYSQREPQWFGEQEIPDPNTMDLAEIDAWRREVQERQEQIEQELLAKRKADRKKALEEKATITPPSTPPTPQTPPSKSDTDDEE